MRKIFCKDPFSWLNRAGAEETPVAIVSPSSWSAVVFLFLLFLGTLLWAFFGTIPLFVETTGHGEGQKEVIVQTHNPAISVGKEAELFLSDQRRVLARVIEIKPAVKLRANEAIEGPFQAKILIRKERPIDYVR